MRRVLPCSTWLLVVAAACSGAEPVDGVGLALRDPLDLIDDVRGDLRLLVFPSATHACDVASGLVTPSPPEEQGAAVADAVVDVSVSTSAPQSTVQLDPGSYTVLVRGWGTDVVSGRMNVIIASGCAGGVAIDRGETREIAIDLIQIFGEGLCGDGTVSPDEQCDDDNTVSGDGCSATCRTEPFLVSIPPGGVMASEQMPDVAWAPGTRLAVTYDSDATGNREAHLMLLSETGGPITTPTALQVDAPVAVLPAVQTSPAVSIGGGRIAVAFADFQGGSDGGDVQVQFVDTSRVAMGGPQRATPASPGAQTAPATATMADGTTLVVFQDSTSATGLSGALFAAGSTTPSFVDVGAAGGTAPSVTATAAGFAVAFAAAGDVLLQRFDAAGASAGEPANVLDDPAGTQDQPSVAALPGGNLLVAWRDSTGDGAGTAVRARAFGPDGTPAGGPITVNSTTAGDQAEPSVAAGAERFAVAFRSGTEIRAAILNADGVLALNREPEPSTRDFPVAGGAVAEHAAAASNSQWIVVWREGADIRGRLFPLP